MFHYEYRILKSKFKNVVYCSILSFLNIFIDKKTFHNFTEVVKSRLGLAALIILK